MKKCTFIILSTFLLVAVLGCSEKNNNPLSNDKSDEIDFTAENYFPLKVGCEWNYKLHGDEFGKESLNIFIPNKIIRDGIGFYQYYYGESSEYSYYGIENNIVYEYIDDEETTIKKQALYDFNKIAGESYEIDSNSTISYMGLETVTTPVGTFNNCAKFKEVYKYDYSDYEDGQYVWIAPGIGIVKQDYDVWGGGWRELKSYTIPETDNADYTIEKAEDSLNQGEYSQVMQILGYPDSLSTSSKAFYIYNQAYLLNAGIDLTQISGLIKNHSEIKIEDSPFLLDYIHEMSSYMKTHWYQTIRESIQIIDNIWRGETDGIISVGDIAYEYTLLNIMQALLGFCDTNRDGIIDSDDLLIKLSYIQYYEGFEIEGIIMPSQDISSGLAYFLPDHQDNQYTPDDINWILLYALSSLDESRDGVLFMMSNSQNPIHLLSTEELDVFINDIAVMMNYYWYHDNIDNDSDGMIDEEIINGIDDDADGLVDEDTGYHPADATESVNTSFQSIWQKWNMN